LCLCRRRAAGLQGQAQLRTGALHFQLDGFAGRDQRRQDQVQHLAADFDLRGAIGRWTHDLRIQHLP
jgi:hypothetical protein